VVGASAVSAAGILVAVAVLDGGGRAERRIQGERGAAETDAAQARPTEIGEDRLQLSLRLGKGLRCQSQPIAT
jgi:hypothetical protein